MSDELTVTQEHKAGWLAFGALEPGAEFKVVEHGAVCTKHELWVEPTYYANSDPTGSYATLNARTPTGGWFFVRDDAEVLVNKEEIAPYDVVGAIIDFETGAMETEEAIFALFQHLVDTGLAWQLQGMYGRTARRLIQLGLITPA